ncbi:MAG: helix-turn-helix transcriptional regulator [Chloroflexota bacterium]
MMNEADAQRAQKLGSLIQEAREYNGRSPQDIAAVLEVETAVYEQIERGETHVSLPDLEALALALKVPMGYFWGSEDLLKEKPIDYNSLTSLRHRVIGVLLRQLRLQARLSQAEIAEQADLDAQTIAAYETGERPIPFLHLEKLGQLLDVPITHFVEGEHGPLRRHEARLQLLHQFEQLPPDMQLFLANPTNRIYLDTAKKLSEMDVDKLRELAESLIDITW